MEAKEAASATCEVLGGYEPQQAAVTADALREVWLRAAPLSDQGPQSMRDWGIEDPDYEAVGVAVPVLTAMGKELGKVARRQVGRFLPLARLLWVEYGREGRIVAAVSLGPMELAEPETVVPAIYELAQTCAFWEDCDQLAMKALEPILRMDPANWLARLGQWVTDENKWVLCDVIRNMWKALLPQFVELLPIYRTWLETGVPQARRSVEGAIRRLESV